MLTSKTPSEVINLPPRIQYIDRLLEEKSLSIIHGGGGEGKSYMTVAMAAVMAAGGDIGPLVRARKPVPVTYMQTEGNEEDFGERVKWHVERLNQRHIIDKNLHFIDIAPINMANWQDKGVNELIGWLKETRSKVLFVDSLYSSLRGSMSSDETAMGFHETVKILRYEVPGLAIVGIHHDHRAKLDETGNVIDEGAGSFFGSGFWYNMCDQFLKWKRDARGNGVLKQTKSRSVRTEIKEPIHILFDGSTGEMVASDQDEAGVDTNIRRWIIETEGREFKTADLLDAMPEVSRRTVSRHLGLLKDAAFIDQTQKGVYKWIQN